MIRFRFLMLSPLLAASLAFAAPPPVDVATPSSRPADTSASAAPATTSPSPAGDTEAAVAAQPTGHSGFRLLSRSTNALMSRLALADQAKETIELQTYIFNDDDTGRLVADRLLKAADRGVAVRLLLDAFESPDPQVFDALDAHANVEVRLFNPFRLRDPGTLSTLGQMLLEFSRLNRRMHNKSFIVDGRVAIIGGRNIGDEYFDAADGANFRDLDLLAIGPVVGDARRAFDVYWNDEASVPLHAFGDERRETEDLDDLREDIAESLREFSESDYAEAVVAELPDGPTAARAGEWFWGPAEMVADHPDKGEAGGDQPGLRIGPRLRQVLDAARTEVLMSTPYFVPGEDDIAHLVGLVRRGVDVAVLTNSLDSTDHASVHGAYAERRRPLLEGGVRLFEMRLRPERAPSPAVAANDANVALHAKSFVVDRRYVFIGSLNMDQRSKLLNTEMGLIVDNAELGAAVARWFEGATTPAAAYQVGLDDDGALRWISEEDGERVIHTREPEGGVGRRAGAALSRLLPVDHLL
jgi:putative cardiolipin synthase